MYYNHLMESESELQAVLAAAARLQTILKGAVLVGGTAAAQHAGHRISIDADHVITDLRSRFDQVLEALETTDGWVTARTNRPLMILGSLDGVETGIRQLMRRRPLEIEEVKVGKRVLQIPTLEEMIRIKAWLVLRRNATRDYLDLVALCDRLGSNAPQILLSIDKYYEDQIGSDGLRVATQLAKQLADPAPYDFEEVDLPRYRKLVPRWRDWTAVVATCRGLVASVLELVARGEV